MHAASKEWLLSLTKLKSKVGLKVSTRRVCTLKCHPTKTACLEGMTTNLVRINQRTR